MLSAFAKFLLALSALSPVAFVWAISDYSRNGYQQEQLTAGVCAILLTFICYCVLYSSSKKLNSISFSVEEIKSMDNEVVSYIVTYLFPLVAPATGVSLEAQIAVFLILAYVLSTSNSFTFNPILNAMGYHFYEVKCTSGVSYLLLSKNEITDVKAIKSVGRLSKHLMLDLT